MQLHYYKIPPPVIVFWLALPLHLLLLAFEIPNTLSQFSSVPALRRAQSRFPKAGTEHLQTDNTAVSVTLRILTTVGMCPDLQLDFAFYGYTCSFLCFETWASWMFGLSWSSSMMVFGFLEMYQSCRRTWFTGFVVELSLSFLFLPMNFHLAKLCSFSFTTNFCRVVVVYVVWFSDPQFLRFDFPAVFLLFRMKWTASRNLTLFFDTPGFSACKYTTLLNELMQSSMGLLGRLPGHLYNLLVFRLFARLLNRASCFGTSTKFFGFCQTLCGPRIHTMVRRVPHIRIVHLMLRLYLFFGTVPIPNAKYALFHRSVLLLLLTVSDTDK